MQTASFAIGRLHAHRAEDEPAVGAVDHRRGDEHARAENERSHEEKRREGAQHVVVHP
jgi:hypothetical protein